MKCRICVLGNAKELRRETVIVKRGKKVVTILFIFYKCDFCQAEFKVAKEANGETE